MSNLNPLAFDIETSGFDDDAVITVAGFAHDLGESVICNLDGRSADRKALVTALDDHSERTVQLELVTDDDELSTLFNQSEVRCFSLDASGSVSLTCRASWFPI